MRKHIIDRPQSLEESPIQLAFDGILSQAAIKDVRPLPLIISDKWGFPLTYVDNDGNPDNYLYSARDWYMGLGGASPNWSTSKNDWLYKDNQLNAETVLIETKRERRAPEMLEYVTEKGIYDITQNMRVVKSNEERLKPIKDYVSIAARDFDSVRRGSKRGKKIEKAIVSKNRQDSIDQRKGLAATVKSKALRFSPMLMGRLTNTMYSKLFKVGTEYTAKKEIVSALGLTPSQAKHLRDHVNKLALKSIEMVEEAANAKIENHPTKMTDEEILYAVKQCARIIAPTAWSLAEFAGIDLMTGHKLLTSGKIN